MKWKEGAVFEKAPSGSHLARCYALIDLGTQVHNFAGESRVGRDVRLSFELAHAKMTGQHNAELKGKPYSVHLTVKQSLHPMAKLRGLLEGWRGKKFDTVSVKAFDPKKLVGLACRLSLIENGEFTNVDGISPATPDEVKAMPPLFNPPVFFALDEDFDRAVYDKLHEKTREKIAKSPEYQHIVNPQSQDDADNEPPPTDEGASDDEVPF